jgi:DNA-binding CsgD family transcriptional regulator
MWPSQNIDARAMGPGVAEVFARIFSSFPACRHPVQLSGRSFSPRGRLSIGHRPARLLMNIGVATIEASSTSALSRRVVIIHPMPLMRFGLRAALAGLACAVAEFAGVREARRSVENLACGDVIVAASSEWLRNDGFGAPVGVAVGLVTRAGPPCASSAEPQGVLGAIPTNATPELARKMVVELAAGRSFFFDAPNLLDRKLARLTSRQLEILEMMARGLFNKQIAHELGLTLGAVKGQVSHILEKLDCHWRTQAVAVFVQRFGDFGSHAKGG